VQRLYDFLRRNPTGVDGFWALVLFGISVVAGTTGRNQRGGTDSMALYVPVVLLLCLVIALRRRLPEKMLLLAAALGVAQLALDVSTTAADFALLVIVYLALRSLLNSSFGYAMVSTREDPLRTEMLGYDVRLIYLTVFVLAGALAGLSGVLFASWNYFFAPSQWG